MTTEGRTLTDADVAALREALGIHQCRFHVDQKEFETAWPILLDFANTVGDAKKLSRKLIVGGVVALFLGALYKGLWSWVIENIERFSSK